jgi:hypothetical protein
MRWTLRSVDAALFEPASSQLHPLLAAALTPFHRHELALLHIELARGLHLPFMKARRAQRFAVSALLFELAKVEDVGHWEVMKVMGSDVGDEGKTIMLRR